MTFLFKRPTGPAPGRSIAARSSPNRDRHGDHHRL